MTALTETERNERGKKNTVGNIIDDKETQPVNPVKSQTVVTVTITVKKRIRSIGTREQRNRGVISHLQQVVQTAT